MDQGDLVEGLPIFASVEQVAEVMCRTSSATVSEIELACYCREDWVSDARSSHRWYGTVSITVGGRLSIRANDAGTRATSTD